MIKSSDHRPHQGPVLNMQISLDLLHWLKGITGVGSWESACGTCPVDANAQTIQSSVWQLGN